MDQHLAEAEVVEGRCVFFAKNMRFDTINDTDIRRPEEKKTPLRGLGTVALLDSFVDRDGESI